MFIFSAGLKGRGGGPSCGLWPSGQGLSDLIPGDSQLGCNSSLGHTGFIPAANTVIAGFSGPLEESPNGNGRNQNPEENQEKGVHGAVRVSLTCIL